MIMIKPPSSEVNIEPSQVSIHPISGVQAQLDAASKQPPQFNGITLDDMRGSDMYGPHDRLDRVAVAQREYNKATKALGESEIGRNYSKLLQQSRQRSIRK